MDQCSHFDIKTKTILNKDGSHLWQIVFYVAEVSRDLIVNWKKYDPEGSLR